MTTTTSERKAPTMSNFIEIPRAFYDDHVERDLPAPAKIWGKPMVKRYVICRDDPSLPELINDAQYYADPNGPDTPDLRPLDISQ
jgi:hypothetical protein